VLAEAQSTSKAARRAAARLPDHRSAAADIRPLAAAAASSADTADDDARVPPFVEDEAWKTEFLP